MRLNNKELGEVLDSCVLAPGNIWRQQRLELHARWHVWINPDGIRSLSDEELKCKFLEYFNSHDFIAVRRDRLVGDVHRLRATITFLLDPTVSLKSRVNGVLERMGKYRLEGFGRAVATSLLMDFDPYEFPVWNAKVEKGLLELGRHPTVHSAESSGDKYLAIRTAVKRVRELRPQLTYVELDHFFHLVLEDHLTKAVINHKLRNA